MTSPTCSTAKTSTFSTATTSPTGPNGPNGMSFQPFTVVTGAAIPLMRSNVDTDDIICIERMTALPKDAWGAWALEPLRFLADSREDPSSILNQPRFSGAPILLAGFYFGCGSSREPAVTALQGMGLRCVIAPELRRHFLRQMLPERLLPIRLELPQVRFSVDRTRRDALLNGLNDIGLTLQDEPPLVIAWQQADRLRRPWPDPQSR